MASADPSITASTSTSDIELLHLALGDVSDRERWDRWQQQNDLHDSVGATYDLLAALSATVQRLDPDHPELKRLRGTYRKLWVVSKQHLAVAREASTVLCKASIPSLEPPDQTCAQTLNDPATFRLLAPRICVEYRDGGSALDALLSAGWTFDHESMPQRSARFRLTQHTWPLLSPTGGTATLTSTFNPWLGTPGSSERVWDRAVGENGSVRKASTPDVLLSILVDGLGASGGSVEESHSTLRWTVGVSGIARAHPDLSLHEVVEPINSLALIDRLELRLGVLSSVDLGVASIDRWRSELQRRREELILAPPQPERAGAIKRLGRARVAAARFDGVRSLRAYLRTSGG